MLILGYFSVLGCGVWWWRWHLDILLPCHASLLQFDRGERKKRIKNYLHIEQ